MAMNPTQTTNPAEEQPEMKQLDMIISKVEQMIQGKVDPQEILTDLQDFKAMCNGEGDMSQEPPQGMAGMIDKMGGQG